MKKHELVIFATLTYLLTAAAGQTCKNVTSTSKYKGRYFGNTTINVTSSVSVLTTPSVYACHHVCSGRTDCNALSYNTSRNQLMNCKLFNEQRYETHMVRDETSVAILLLPMECGYNSAVDGGWSSWHSEGDCYGEKNCQHNHTRECLSPKPRCGGNECTGIDKREVLCNTNYTKINIVGFPCEQSSTKRPAGGECHNALDGDTQTTKTHTDKHATTPSWWQVDLKTTHTIGAVVIYNRRGQLYRLRNFLIRTQNVSESLSASAAEKQICVENQPVNGETVRILICQQHVTGRFVVIENEVDQFLHMREVHIYVPEL